MNIKSLSISDYNTGNLYPRFPGPGFYYCFYEGSTLPEVLNFL